MNRPLTDAHRRLIRLLLEKAMKEVAEHPEDHKSTETTPASRVSKRPTPPIERLADGSIRIRFK